MHPRSAMASAGPTAAHAGGRAAGVRARARHGASARGRRLLRPRHGDELLGRLLERHHAPAGRDALSRAAAVARREGGVRIYAARDQPVEQPDAAGAAGAGRRARRCRRGDLRAAAGAEPVMAGAPAALAAPQWRSDPDAGARSGRERGCRTRVSRDVDWYWAADEATDGEVNRTMPCGCSRRSIRWCGIAAGSSCSGPGRYRFEAYTPAAKRTLRLLRAAAAVAGSDRGLGERHVFAGHHRGAGPARHAGWIPRVTPGRPSGRT